MAGDWIKVVKGAGEKPETLKIARMLGVPRREAYGILVEFWEWLDSNSVDGIVDGVVDADVDALMSCPGLSALLKLVHWAEFDNDPTTGQPRLRIINFERHNGETSKNRVLRNRRQAKWRENVDDHVDTSPSTKASTREEKRREDIKPKSLAHSHQTFAKNGIQALGSRLPEDWKLPEEWKDWALAARPEFNPQQVVRLSIDFRDYWIAKPGKDGRKANWLATWRRWVRTTETVK